MSASPPQCCRIAMVTGSLEAGGAERVLAEMANYWSRKGWQVTLATWAGPASVDFYALEPEVRREWLDVQGSNDSSCAKLWAYVRRIRKLRHMLKATQPDVVLSFIDTSNVMTLLACLGLRVRVVISERVNGADLEHLPLLWRTMRRATYWRADAVVAQTEEAARWISRLCGVRAVTVANPLRTLPEPNAVRESMILAIGRLTHQKGFDILLEAFEQICGEFPDWRLVIIGQGPDLAKLQSLCRRSRLVERVQIFPPVKDVEAFLARAGLVVQPSRFEGFPNVLLEAMGMGATVISTDCRSGPSDIIQDGVNGRLVPVEDVSALSDAMASLLRNPERRVHLGREARKVRQSFRQDLIMNQWERCVAPLACAGPMLDPSDRGHSA